MRRNKVALVINPRTGQNVAKLNDVLAIFAAADWKTQFVLKEYAGQTMALAKDAAKKNDLLVAYGGDGTLSQVVNGVMQAKGHHPAVGLIPGGTGNFWAGGIGIPVDSVKAALALVGSETRKIDLGHVDVDELTLSEGATDNKKEQQKSARGKRSCKHHFLLMAGLGADAAVAHSVSKQLKYRVGPLAIGLAVARELPLQRTFPVEISVPGSDIVPLWKGEAMQVVVGNTRRMGMDMELTPNAYIDDGILNVCVITAGGPLTTMQQAASLLLRRKPHDLTAEFFQGAHLCIRVPATVPLQLDGSPIQLKDYLRRSDKETLQEAGDEDQVMVSYRFDVLPQVLEVAIPRTYNDTLFEESGSASQPSQADVARQIIPAPVKVSVHHHHEGEPDVEQTDTQRHTEAHESRPASRQHHTHDQSAHTQEDHGQNEQNSSSTQNADHDIGEQVEPPLEKGRKVTVIGKTIDSGKKDTYIIAGSTAKVRTGDVQPVAVVANSATSVVNQQGEGVPLHALEELREGVVIVVDGKKSKRGVIRANSLVI